MMDVYIFSDEVLETSWFTWAREWGKYRLLKHKDSMERKAEFIRVKERLRVFLMDQTYSRIMQ